MPPPAKRNGETRPPVESQPRSKRTRQVPSILPSLAAPPTPKPKSIRISRIPKAISSEHVKAWLERLPVALVLESTAQSGNLIHFSIAPNTAEFSQAIATFSHVPAAFLDVDKGTQNVEGPYQSTVAVDSHFYGMTVLSDSRNLSALRADVIAIPGLGGHALGSWKSPDDYKVWLRDFLPYDVKGARTVIYGYNTDLKEGNWKVTIDTLAKSMLDNLKSVRDEASRGRPLIFMGHSLGGLIIKQALINVVYSKDYEHYQDVLENCCSVIFFGVPNQGIIFDELMNMVQGKRSERFVRELLPDNDSEESPLLSGLNMSFGYCAKHFTRGTNSCLDVLCYYESKPTQISKFEERLLVTKSSATYTGDPVKPYNTLKIEGDHRSMVKFRTPVDEGYQSVKQNIEEFIKRATQTRTVTSSKPTPEDGPCLQSLAFVEMSFRKQEADQADENTCRWILEHNSFLKWTESDRGLLWVKGKPGSGKSTLMAFIRGEFQKNNQPEDILTLDFFFHGRGTQLQKTPVGMFRSLLYQLFIREPIVRGPILAEFKEKSYAGEAGKTWDWQLKELQNLFFEAVLAAAPLRKLIIFVDALDEAGAEIAKQLAKYFHHLNDELHKRAGSTRICISCRHFPIVHSIPGLDVVVEDNNRADIVSYVKHQLRHIIHTERNSSINSWQSLADDIARKAQGVFQWAGIVIPLVVRYHEAGESFHHIHKKLKEVPKELNDVYEHILKNVIEDRNWPRTLHLMQWICLAERPLSVTELRYAIGSDDMYVHLPQQSCKESIDFIEDDFRMQKLINSLSGGLVEVNYHDAHNRVQFVHQSVNDFLLSTGLNFLVSSATHYEERRERICFSAETVLGQSQDRISRSCINYLRLGDIINAHIPTIPPNISRVPDGQLEEIKKFLQNHPFIDYATKTWFVHAEKAETCGILQRDLIQRFESQPQQPFQTWIKISAAIMLPEWEYPKKPILGSTLLHVASSANLHSTLEDLILAGHDVNQQDSLGGRALHYAARWGYQMVVQMLLEAGAEIDRQDKEQRTAFELAAVNGREDVVKLLLNRGADVNKSTGFNGNALQAAALNGRRRIVEQLLQAGAKVNAQGGRYGNALQAASLRDNPAIVEQLLQAGAEVNAQGGRYGNALQAASLGGNPAIIEQLLQAGAEVNAQGGEFGNALQAAAYGGSRAMVEQLLQAGAEVNAQGGEFGNALQAAAFRDNPAIIEQLLQAGAEVNAQGGRYGNALQAASLGGNPAIIEQLLQAGAEVNAQGGRYGNALQAAAYGGSRAMVEQLLQAGAEVNAQGGEYGNALQAALIRANRAIIEQLLQAGAKVNAQGGRYGNAL